MKYLLQPSVFSGATTGLLRWQDYTKEHIVNIDHSYWCVHFCSIIECLLYHHQMSLGIHKLSISEPKDIKQQHVSLCNLGRENIAYIMRSNLEKLHNWGAQYLLANLLNFKRNDVALTILKNVLYISNLIIPSGFDIMVYVNVSGRDSTIGHELLANNGDINFYSSQSGGPYIVGEHLFTNDKHSLFCTDLCFVVRCHNHTTNEHFVFTLFGEVEGNSARRNPCMNGAYFRDKSKHVSFGVNLIPSGDGEENLTHIDTGFGNGVVLWELLTSRGHIMHHYYCAWDNLWSLCTRYPQGYVSPGACGDILNLISLRFDTPLPILINELRGYINDNDFIKNTDLVVPDPATISVQKRG